MLYTEEQIQRANERSISEFFRQEGYSCKKIRSETHIAGFGGFYVKDTAVPLLPLRRQVQSAPLHGTAYPALS